jgi:hypothetical protein
MIIYHGGTEIVDVPKIMSINRGRDFGIGFYTTTIREQAEKWAIRQSRNRRVGTAVLNIYEYDDINAIEQLKTRMFGDYTMDWLDLVISCRQDGEYNHGFDIVSGKIADDDVGETVQAVIDGLSSKDFALSKLVFMPANDQICFCTDESLTYLKFIESEVVK